MFITSGTTKARSVPGSSFSYRSTRSATPNGVYTLFSDTVGLCDGTQITESDRNRWPLPKKGPLEDVGSEFFTQKKELVTNKFPYSILYLKPISTGNRYTKSYGNIIANCFKTHSQLPTYQGAPDVPLKLDFPPDLSSSRSALEVKGAIAVAACAPANQIANAASAVGELMQDLPAIPGVALWESRLKAISTAVRAGAGEFLNVVFAISPTIGDMKQFLTAVHNIDKVVDQFERDSGRVVRREFHFPKEVTVTEEVLSNVYSPVGMMKNIITGEAYNTFNSSNHNSLPCYETVRTRTVEREIWFSGAFTYHLPTWYDSHDKTDRKRLMAQLFGAKPDLNTLWQLTPWSWAVDWVFDAGTFVKNLNDHFLYGTVMRYGYVMETTTVTDVYSAGSIAGIVNPANMSSYGNSPYPAVSPVTLRTTTKKRIQANPFGFGLNWDGLSSTQKAIAAALGITRVVR